MTIDRADVAASYRRGIYPWTPAHLGHRVVVTDDGCWLWTGAKDPSGYGRIKFRGRMDMAHRVAHRLSKGTIPPFFQVDHLCYVRACVNPEHLEAVTPVENVYRANRRLRSFRYGTRVLVPVAALDEWTAAHLGGDAA